MNQIGPKTTRNQAGSAIIWIFIMIVLFATLSYVFTQNMRGSATNISQYEIDLAATEIIDYARSIKDAVHELRINGCSDTEISFENNVVAGYTNANAPADNSCHVFHSKGGGLSYQQPDERALDNSFTGSSSYQSWVATGNVRFTNHGSSDLDLLLYIPYLNEAVCQKINEKANSLGTTIPVDTFSASGFSGVYSASVQPDIGNEATELQGIQAFCAQRGASSWYYFFSTLIAR